MTQFQPLSLRQDTSFFQRAHRFSNPYFLLYWEKISEDQTSRISVIIPKHQLKTSVKRHQLKRRLKACVQHLNWSNPMNVVFVANQKAGRLPFSELSQIVRQACSTLPMGASAIKQ